MRSASAVHAALIALSALLSSASAFADPAPTGSVCVAPKPSAAALAAESRTPRPDVAYAVTIDGRPEVALSDGAAGWVHGLDRRASHSVVILADGRQSESFFFRFDEGHDRLCLFLSPLYMTWQLWPIAQTGAWCPFAENPPSEPQPNSAS